MAKPTILTVDDDPAVSRAIARDLRSRYGADYRVSAANSGSEAVELVNDLCLKGRALALVACDQRMPSMSGIEVLAEVRRLVPDAKLLLLTAYADTDVAINAINEIGLDYYLLKPWDPPGERLYPVTDGLLSDWRAAHPEDTAEVRVVGDRWSDRSHDIKTFLTRNYVPYRWLDVERDEEAIRLISLAEASASELPLVLIPDGADPAIAHHPGSGHGARPADHGRHLPVRPVHRRERAGRAGRRGLRGIGGAADGAGRATLPRRPGRTERGDRELSRLPQGLVRQ